MGNVGGKKTKNLVTAVIFPFVVGVCCGGGCGSMEQGASGTKTYSNSTVRHEGHVRFQLTPKQ